jgi:hypothetical protein
VVIRRSRGLHIPELDVYLDEDNGKYTSSGLSIIESNDQRLALTTLADE